MENEQAQRVAIYDSGVGGLTIHAALKARRPELNYLFVSDNHAYPYGTKSDEVLIPRVRTVVDAIVQELSPDLVVVACNTASTVALTELRATFTVPFVGVVPAIKPAARTSTSKKIALLGTPATMARAYTQNLIDEFAADCEVLKVGSSLLVEMAEKKLRGEELPLKLIAQELSPINEFSGCDVIVLCCTHFPLLIDEIKQVCRLDAEIIDSGDAIAKRVSSLLPIRASNQATDSASWMTRALDVTSPMLAPLRERGLNYQGVLSFD